MNTLHTKKCCICSALTTRGFRPLFPEAEKRHMRSSWIWIMSAAPPVPAPTPQADRSSANICWQYFFTAFPEEEKSYYENVQKAEEDRENYLQAREDKLIKYVYGLKNRKRSNCCWKCWSPDRSGSGIALSGNISNKKQHGKSRCGVIRSGFFKNDLDIRGLSPRLPRRSP